jgi:Xaa-Pro aminopeptidase
VINGSADILRQATSDLIEILRQRRQRLAALIEFPVILWSGHATPRNYPANLFPFRASSHFLYFAGLPVENAAIRLEGGKLELFMDNAPPSSALWHGEMPTREEMALQIGAEAAFPLAELTSRSRHAATIAVQDATTYLQQCQILDRPIFPSSTSEGIDRELAQAIASLRLVHDAGALAELRQAAACTVQAHQAGMAATLTAKTEAEIRAAMEGVIIGHNMTCAYNSIVTVYGEVLHNEHHHHQVQAGDLVLADVGAETQMGWAADVTRTWPVTGRFSPTQRDLYQVVLAAHDACIEQVRPGKEYQDIHFIAAKVMAQGLVDLGILRGSAEDLVEMDAHALFFPHGVGHLVGLDVHDMEDLGDLAGYEVGRVRSDRFGLGYLRLNRILQAGMLVTIEPGFYQVPAILNDSERRAKYEQVVNWERLAQFADVRGIRIEDDVLVTASGSEVLTAALPTDIDSIEQMVKRESRSQPAIVKGSLNGIPLFAKRCRQVFEQVYPQLIHDYSGWFIAIEADSREYFLDVEQHLAKQKAISKYPDGMICTFQLLETVKK